jgi:resuscitation-promoting factor RpfB
MAAGLTVAFIITGPLAGKTSFGQNVLADSSRVVSLFHDGQKKVFTTDAKTVKDALERAGVSLSEGDIVEPKADADLTDGFFYINVFRARPVIVVDGQTVRRLMSPYESPKLIAQSAGLTVYPEDRFVTGVVTDFVGDQIVGERVEIDRATPIEVLVDGKLLTLRSHEASLGDVLRQNRISLGEKDTVLPELDTPTVPGLRVTITRVTEVTTTKLETLPRSHKTISDPGLYIGQNRVVDEGKDGSREVTYKIQYHNGVEVNRQTLKIDKQVNPVTKVVAKGTKIPDDVWSRLRMCESGNSYSRNSGNGYYGAYQFDIGTWGRYGGYARADLAPPSVQDEKARLTQSARGWYPWPTCGRKLGLI